jgi:hypothetical protein
MQGAVESGTCWAPPRHMGHDLAGVSRQSVMLPNWVEIGRHAAPHTALPTKGLGGRTESCPIPPMMEQRLTHLSESPKAALRTNT